MSDVLKGESTAHGTPVAPRLVEPRPGDPAITPALVAEPVSYTHLTLPTNREV